MSRQHRALRSPEGVDLTRIPDAERAQQPLHRAIDARHRQPWWFSNRSDAGEDAGRFDLDGDRGTCYFATSAVGAILERVADPHVDDPPLVSTRTLEGMTLWRGEAPLAPRLADVTIASVPELTGEISTVEEYTLPWAWADALDATDRDGILYRGRFAQEECIAVFGDAGARPLDQPPAPLEGEPAVNFELRLPPSWRAGVSRPPTAADSPRAMLPEP